MSTSTKRLVHARAIALLGTFALVASSGSSPLRAGEGDAPDGVAEKASSGAEKKELTYLLQPPPVDFSPPALSLREPNYDWGKTLKGEVVTHTFVYENTGGSPLRIERVKPACGCTTVDFDKVIAPGQRGQMTLKIDTKRFSGKLKKTAAIYSNAGREPYTVAMEGEIEEPFTIEPNLPRIDYVRGMQAEPLQVLLRASSARKIEFRGATVEETKKDIVRVEFEEVEPSALYRLKVTPTVPDTAAQYHTVEVNVQTVADGKPLDVPVRISIKVRNRIEATPPSFYFTRTETDKLKAAGSSGVSKSSEIRTLDPNHSFQVTGVEVIGSTFQANLETVAEGKHYRVVVTLPDLPSEDTRRISEKVIVNTTDEMVPQITMNAIASLGYRGTRAGAAGGVTSQPLRPLPTPSRPGTTAERRALTTGTAGSAAKPGTATGTANSPSGK